MTVNNPPPTTPSELSLRDYFAAMAIIGLVSTGETRSMARAAETAYGLADAMIEERGREPDLGNQ